MDINIQKIYLCIYGRDIILNNVGDTKYHLPVRQNKFISSAVWMAYIRGLISWDRLS